ncbi:DER1-domain-containing protein [Panus rudis PR-1116 ss-1]|nr:DER1-domain-containing protein [Panus rudis PR-1116 ss-1]
MSFWDEIRKIPPVTRFLCGSSLAVSLPVMVQLVSPYKVLFVRELVTRRFELWRVYTSFFLGGSGINYLFDFVMLYRNSDQLESSVFARKSADYAWQLLLAAAGILALNLPLRSFIHARPLLVALTYLSSRLAPPGSQTSLFGLISLPLVYFPYALIAMDLVMAGPSAAASSLTGAIVGHLWWWGVFDTRALQRVGQAPTWLRNLVGNSDGSGSTGTVGGAGSGVHVIPPRRARTEATGTTSGHRWGSGHRLGEQ